MIDVALDDLLSYLPTLTSTDLPGIQKVQKSDADVMSILHPAITGEWDGVSNMVNNGNHVDISATFGLMLYVTNMRGKAETDQEISQLVFRWDAGLGRFAGLLPALWKARGWKNSTSGKCFRMTVGKEVRVGRVISKSQQHYTAGASVRVTVTTLFDPEDYGYDPSTNLVLPL